MDCPKCRRQMTDGTANIHGTTGTFLIFGLSYQQLWFKASHDKFDRPLSAMRPNLDYRSWYCEDCRVLTVENIDEP